MREALPIAGLAGLAVIKLWAIVTPFSGSRLHLGGDFGLAVEPYFYHQLKRGILPLWDPTLGTGSPFLGGGTHHPMFLQAHLHLFYPLNLLVLGLLERGQHIPHLALQYHHLLHYAMAGGFTYAYARQLGVGRFAASVSGIAFMFSGFMLAHIPHWTMIDTVAWLPAILACLVRADSTRRPRWGALGGLALGVAFLAGHPQLFYHVVLATVALGLTLVLRRAAAGEPWRKLAQVLLLVPVVALGVSAIQLVPSWELMMASHRAGLGYDWKTTGSLLPAYLAQALLPWGLFTVSGWKSSGSEYYLYPGVLPLILAIHALRRRWDWRVGFHAVLGFAAVLLAFGDHYGLYRPTYDLLPGLALFRIPARFVGLAGFSVAVLAGLGAEALVTGPRPTALARGVRRLAALAVVGVVPLMLVLVWAQGQPNADDFQNFASQYLMLVIFLAGAALVVSWPGRASPRALCAAALVVLVADLVFGSYPVTDTSRNPDIRPPREQEWVAAISRTTEPLRLSRDAHIHPQTIYRYGWGVVDGESTFAPPAFLDLYSLGKEHPRIQDLLNVRYVLPARSGPPPAPATPAAPLRMWPGAVRRLPLPVGGAARQVEVHSHLVHGLDVPQGQTVATAHVIGTDGTVATVPLRAGIETAEWSLDRPGTKAGHGRPPVVRSWSVPEGYQGHTYRAMVDLPKGLRPAQILLEGGPGPAVLVVERLAVDGIAAWPPGPEPERFRQITAGLYENLRALPRAFLVRRARQVPAAQMLDQLGDLDPSEEVLTAEPPPPGFTPAPRLAGAPLPPVRVVTYAPEQVSLETDAPEPAVLLLSDTFDGRWRAWDNGQPAPIARADHALRAVFLPAGRHRVEFRYRQPSVFVGLGLTLATLLALGGAAVMARRRERAASPPA
ncbi:MAG TPA: YfhO family protein [Methylomirabilota bacterium]